MASVPPDGERMGPNDILEGYQEKEDLIQRNTNINRPLGPFGAICSFSIKLLNHTEKITHMRSIKGNLVSMLEQPKKT